MARYTLPSLLQGHPPSQSSGTLMSLQEGIAEPCARMVVLKPSCREPAGRRSDLPCGVTAMPSTQYSILASCLRYLTRVFPSPPPRTLFPSQVARGSFHSAQPRPHLAPQGGGISRGEAGMFRRDIRVSEAKRGRVPCRSKEHTASTHPTQPSLTTTSNPK